MTARTYTDTDAYVPSIWTPTVARSLTIEAGDVFIDAAAEYDADDGSILFVTINDRRVSWQNFDAALRLLGIHDEHSRWADDLDTDTLLQLNVDQRAGAYQRMAAK
jgi:hypothetical protein